MGCDFTRMRLNYSGMAKREDIDLWLLLTDPVQAREYIARFDWSCPPEYRPTEIMLDSGRRIDFKDMSDQDAVVAATQILRDVEVPLVIRERNLQLWEQ